MTDKLSEPNPNLHFKIGGTGYYADEILRIHDTNQNVPRTEIMPIGTTVSLEALRAALNEVAALEQRVDGMESLQEASIKLYCGVIDKAEWRIAVRNSPKGQELIALAAEEA